MYLKGIKWRLSPPKNGEKIISISKKIHEIENLKLRHLCVMFALYSRIYYHSFWLILILFVPMPPSVNVSAPKKPTQKYTVLRSFKKNSLIIFLPRLITVIFRSNLAYIILWSICVSSMPVSLVYLSMRTSVIFFISFNKVFKQELRTQTTFRHRDGAKSPVKQLQNSLQNSLVMTFNPRKLWDRNLLSLSL